MKKLPSLLLFSLLLFSLLLAALALPAFAQAPATADPCPKCGEGVLQQLETVYTPWLVTGALRCTEDPHCLDDQLARSVFYTWRCDHCRQGVRRTEIETRTAHLHNKHYLAKFQRGTL